MTRVSIHAPAWGATLQGREMDNQQTFQSTHPHGVRPDTHYSRKNGRMFQSTHPHGVRPERVQAFTSIVGFNPRTRMGCDVSSPFRKTTKEVSIHAPAWGATAGGQ